MGAGFVRMNSRLHKVLCAASVALALAGCSSDNSNEATLEIADVQGISFNDPLPAEPATAPSLDEAAPAETAPVDAPVIAPESDVAEAEVPEIVRAEEMPDIAQIPTATPVPSPTPSQPSPTPAPQEARAVVAAANADGFTPLSFNLLSGFKYIEPIPSEGERPEEVEARRNTDQIPAEVKALDGQKVIVEGWMVPMEINDDASVKSFVLVKTQPQCCFGDTQSMNEWVDVIMEPGTKAEFNVDLPVKVYGQLEVGEKIEDGFVLSIYRMTGNRVDI